MTTPFALVDDLTPSDDDLIDYATALIRMACEWHIYPSLTATQRVDICAPLLHAEGDVSDSCGPERLYLWTLQLTAVQSAALPDGTVLTTEDLLTDPVGWVERADGLRWPSTGTVVFDFTHGYSLVPPEIKAVAVSITKRMPASMAVWTSRKMGTAVLEMAPRVSIPPGSFSVAEGLVLERYRIPGTRA